MLLLEFLKTHVFVSVAWLLQFLKEPPVLVFNTFQVNVSSSSQNHCLWFFWGKIKTKEPQVAFILKTLKKLGFFFLIQLVQTRTVLWPSLEK
jgi:hypothetical protein